MEIRISHPSLIIDTVNSGAFVSQVLAGPSRLGQKIVDHPKRE
jgi:hypothetical protein